MRDKLDSHDNRLVGHHLEEGPADPDRFLRNHNAAVRELRTRRLYRLVYSS